MDRKPVLIAVDPLRSPRPLPAGGRALRVAPRQALTGRSKTRAPFEDVGRQRQALVARAAESGALGLAGPPMPVGWQYDRELWELLGAPKPPLSDPDFTRDYYTLWTAGPAEWQTMASLTALPAPGDLGGLVNGFLARKFLAHSKLAPAGEACLWLFQQRATQLSVGQSALGASLLYAAATPGEVEALAWMKLLWGWCPCCQGELPLQVSTKPVALVQIASCLPPDLSPPPPPDPDAP